MNLRPIQHCCRWMLLGSLVVAIGCEGRVGKQGTPNAEVSKAKSDKQDADTTSTDEAMLTVQSEPFTTTEDGREVTIYTIRNRKGMKVELINLGGILTSVLVPDKDGKFENVTSHFSEPAGYLANGPYFGGICGRYANRIAGGKFALDGQEYQLFLNGPNHIHGGKDHFMKKVWNAEPIQSADEAGVKLTYISADMEEGYPGKLKTVVTYTLNDNNELTMAYEATTDKATVLNLTNHAYWNLSGVVDSTILDHELTLYCDKYLPVDETAIPKGDQEAVAGTPMDFLTPHKIGERIDQPVNGNGGYDHCYVVNGKFGELRPAAKVVDPKSGRVMEVSTTEPGVQFYTGNHLKGTPETGGAPMHGALCLETQHFPDSPNHPGFPTTRLDPGETYTQKTIHKFSVAK